MLILIYQLFLIIISQILLYALLRSDSIRLSIAIAIVLNSIMTAILLIPVM